MRMREHFPELSNETITIHRTISDPNGKAIKSPKEPEPVRLTPQWLLNLTPAQMTAVEYAVNSFDVMADAITECADNGAYEKIMKIAEALNNDQ